MNEGMQVEFTSAERAEELRRKVAESLVTLKESLAWGIKRPLRTAWSELYTPKLRNWLTWISISHVQTSSEVGSHS